MLPTVNFVDLFRKVCVLFPFPDLFHLSLDFEFLRLRTNSSLCLKSHTVAATTNNIYINNHYNLASDIPPI